MVLAGMWWNAAGTAVFLASTTQGQRQFEVHPDNMPRLLAGLDEVREEYMKAQDLAAELGNVTPPFGDDVTVAVTKKICERAQGGENSLYDTAQGMIEWVDGFKAAVQKAFDEYQRIDHENQAV